MLDLRIAAWIGNLKRKGVVGSFACLVTADAVTGPLVTDAPNPEVTDVIQDLETL